MLDFSSCQSKYTEEYIGVPQGSVATWNQCAAWIVCE